MIIDDAYDQVQTLNWCKDNVDIAGLRKSCNSDMDCLKNGKAMCDEDVDCFGITWNSNHKDIPLKLCKSPQMEPILKKGGWRTIMHLKRGKEEIAVIFYYVI